MLLADSSGTIPVVGRHLCGALIRPDTAHAKELLQLDPLADHCRMTFLIATCAFPFDVARALELALFRTYAVPRISALLRSTGELTERTRKRYDDTDLLLSEIIEHGYDSPRGKAAIANINGQHARYPIRNEDYLYVLSTFVYEPIRWIDRYGYRPLRASERLAWFYFWRAVGERMNIRDIPLGYEDFEQFNIAYENVRFRFTQSNRDVARQTSDLLLGFYLPRPLFALGRPAIHALLDAPLLSALGIPAQPAWLNWVLTRALRMRGRVAAALPLQQGPVLRTRLRRPTYPAGYTLDDLGSK